MGFADRWIAIAGMRANSVQFRVADYFIVPGNGDDSGSKRYTAATPVAGLLYKVAPAVSAYVNAGRGFETPTNTELAYRLNGTGPNFGLNASRSRHLEAGVKAIVGERLRINAALFDIATRDEIAIESNVGGRSTFKNAGRTHRGGFELGATAALPYGFEAVLAWTRLQARFLDTFSSVANTPAVPVIVRAIRRVALAACADGLQHRTRVPAQGAHLGRRPKQRSRRSLQRDELLCRFHATERQVAFLGIRPRRQPRQPALCRLGGGERRQPALLRAGTRPQHHHRRAGAARLLANKKAGRDYPAGPVTCF